jgi:hypothetical protein
LPLSEHEQRLLDEIERALYAEDPKFASTVRATDLKAHRKRRLTRAGVLFVVGLGVLVAGVVTTQWLVGVGGFGLMLLAAVVAMRAVQVGRRREREAGASPKPPRRARPEGGAKGRFQERWERRWEDRGDR